MITAIVQARMGSERLPNKVLMDIEGHPMVWHVLGRLKHCQELNNIVLAIPDNKDNDVLEEFAKNNKIDYFRGSEEDVLERYFKAAKKFKSTVIVRATADCPLLCPKVVDNVITEHLKSKADYTANNLERSFPLGLDVQVFNFNVLERAFLEARDPFEREHVVPFMHSHPEIFKLHNVKAEGMLQRPELRLTVDTKEDLEIIRRIYKNFYQPGKIIPIEKAIRYESKIKKS